MHISRRTFMKAAGAATATSLYRPGQAQCASADDAVATLIDITRCDGCAGRGGPQCVQACRGKNRQQFPEPDPAMLKDYWPRKGYEDWSSRRDVDSRLTPYNWLFIEEIYLEIDGGLRVVYIPRRCMHCEKPACVEYCPFGTAKKDPAGPVYIEQDLCFGGAKCRKVCPWNVPQRQAGVGVYTELDPIPIGGGSMFKCDLCRDLLADDQPPACVGSCPRQAMQIGPKSQIEQLARERAEKLNGYLYGLEEYGGTGTIYLSDLPFETYDRYLLDGAANPSRVMRFHSPEALHEKSSKLAWSVFFTPLFGAAAAFVATLKKESTVGKADD